MPTEKLTSFLGILLTLIVLYACSSPGNTETNPQVDTGDNDLIPKAMFKGLQDAFDEKESKVSPEELAQELSAWKQMQGLKAKAMGEAARKRIELAYSARKQAQEHLDLFYGDSVVDRTTLIH